MENTSKKLNRLLLLLVAVAMLLGVCLVLAACKPEETTVSGEPVLYWNVEGADYRSGKFTRFPSSEDGYVYMIFTKDGEQVRLPVENALLATKIDMMKCMGLVFNADGVVVDAVRVEDFTGGFVVEEYIISEINGTKVTTNSSGLLDGHEVVLDIPEGTPVWNVAGTGITVGIPWVLNVDDLITVIQDKDGNIMCVYTEAYTEPADIYWNVNRMYDSTAKISTRMSEPTGGYSITLACNGEVKDYKARESSVVQQMDAMAAKCFGLDFDEEGYIIGVTHAGSAAGGGSAASWYHCVGIEGQYAEFERLSSGSNMGAKYTGMMGKNMKVFDVSSSDTMGQETELRVGDQVHCLLDSRTRLAVVFVVNRPVESEIYWNVERKYDSKTAKTTRTADADGWYNILVAVRGKQMTVKTQDWEIANKIDGRAAKCFGLKLDENNVIQKFYTPAQARGDTFASWYDITELDGQNIVVQKNTTGDVKKGTLAPDCEIYNVSSTAVTVGEVTTLQVGDRVHTIKGIDGLVNVAYVVNRYVDWPIYYNLDRKWNDTTKQTTRKPDADGYYVFRMAHEGEEVTVKTTSKNVANAIDKEVAKCLTLSVDQNGIIYKAMHASNATVCKGGASSSWTTVTSVYSTGFTTYKSDTNKKYTEKYAWNAKVFNVSTNFIDHQGEQTKLQVGDFVHCLTNRRGEITYVFVMTRYLEAEVYYNLDRMWNDSTGASTRTPDADGVYSFQMAYGGGEVTVKTTDPEVVYNIDKEVAKCVGLLFDENGYCTFATHAKSTEQCRGGIGMSYATVTEVVGDQVTVTKDGKLTTFTIADDCLMFVTANIEGLTRGNYTTVREGDFVHCLKAKGGKTNYMAIMSRTKQVVKTEHTCQYVTENVTWYEWDGEGFPKSGHYVVTKDLELTKRVTINAGVEITLCLNGHTVTNTDRFFNIHGTLNICDHGNTGKLSSSYTGSSYGAIAYLYNNTGNGTVNVYGGTMEHTGQLTSGAIFFVGNETNDKYVAALNIYDGVLTGGKSTGAGSAILVSNDCTLNIYGGTIKNCSGNGGVINIVNGDTTITGGTIAGAPAVSVPSTSATLTVGGKVQISEIDLAPDTSIAIHADGLDDSSSIGVTVNDTAKPFTTITDANDEKCFAPVDSAVYKLVNDGGDLYLESKYAPHVHCACNGEAAGKPNHTCTDTEYLPWLETDSLPTSGKYYLTGDVTVSKTFEIRGALSLCLNGHTITGSTRIYKIYSTFNLSDCAAKNTDGSYKGKLIGNQTSTTLGPTFYLYSGGTFNLFGGELTVRSDSKTAQAGVGGIQVGTMNMYGGTISGGNVTGKGGCISIFDGAKVRLYGGTITGGKATGGGGNIYVAKGTLEIHNGATISDGYSGATGGNIWLDTSADNHFLMDGGLVTGGSTVATSDKSGGNMDIRCADAKITGGEISDGYAYEGGNIRVGNNGNLIIGGKAVIKDGESKAAGGNIAVFKTLTIEGNAVIKDGTAGGDGGNISAYAHAATATATLIVKGGTISGGSAKNCGSVRLQGTDGTVNATFTGGTITKGTVTGSYVCVLVGSAAGVNVTVGGTANIESLAVASGKKINISTTNPFQTGARVGIYMTEAGVFAEDVTSDVTAFVKSAATGKNVKYDPDAQTLSLE